MYKLETNKHKRHPAKHTISNWIYMLCSELCSNLFYVQTIIFYVYRFFAIFEFEMLSRIIHLFLPRSIYIFQFSSLIHKCLLVPSVVVVVLLLARFDFSRPSRVCCHCRINVL